MLLRERALWGTGLGHFCGNYAFYLVLTWLPLLLVKHHGYTMQAMAAIGAGVYAMAAITAPLTGCTRRSARAGAAAGNEGTNL